MCLGMGIVWGMGIAIFGAHRNRGVDFDLIIGQEFGELLPKVDVFNELVSALAYKRKKLDSQIFEKGVQGAFKRLGGVFWEEALNYGTEGLLAHHSADSCSKTIVGAHTLYGSR